MELAEGDWRKKGYLLFDDAQVRERMAQLREAFCANFRRRFGEDIRRNRNLIKLFAEDIHVKAFFLQPGIIEALRTIGVELPVHTGPVVTHYTANDATSQSHGLPYHQDWPSMGTSSRGVIVWSSLQDVDGDSHGLSFVPGSHLNGVLPGEQTDRGYLVREDSLGEPVDLVARAGQILLMSPYLVHRTRIHPSCADWKLSLSARFDDLTCESWDERNYVSAYGTSVDRDVYRT
jgi:hypothetical protein